MSQPKTLTLDGSINLQADDTGTSLPRISIVAYNGAKMRPSGGWGEVIIDLSGVALPSAAGVVPILLNHSHDRIVGHGQCFIDSHGISLSGVVSGAGPDATEFVESAKRGFPWKASIGLSVAKSTFLKPNETSTINGAAVSGPLTVVERSLLGEISVLPWPADQSSSVSIAAKQGTSTEVRDMTDGTLSVEEIRQQAADETQRIGEIRRICNGGHPEIELQAISEAWDPQRTELAILRAERSRAPRITAGCGHANLSDTDVMAAGLLVSCGQGEIASKYISADAANRAESMRGWHFMDFAKAALQARGEYRTSYSKDEILRAAFSTTSLATSMSTAANKSVLAGYSNAPSAWRSICQVKSVRDFKENTGLRLSSVMNLQEVGAAGEIKHVELSEQSYTFQVGTYAEMVSITRQMLYNDDIGILNDLGPAMGRAAARTVNDLFATVLLANAGSFFAGANNNYFDGAGSTLQSSQLNVACKMLRTMVDDQSRLIDINPQVLLVPADLETTGRELLSSAEVLRTTTDSLPTGNRWKDFVTLVVEPRLGISTYSGYSATAWYLTGGPQDGLAVMAFLNGRSVPTIETADVDFNTLGMQMRCFLDVGCKLSDPRAGIKSKGAA